MSELIEEIEELKSQIDLNRDGRISVEEFTDWAKMVAREYLWLYLTLILGYVSFYKPSGWEDWKTIGLLALMSASAIYGGYLKKNFQRTFQRGDEHRKALEAEILAHKEALSRAAAENERLKKEIEWLKSVSDRFGSNG